YSAGPLHRVFDQLQLPSYGRWLYRQRSCHHFIRYLVYRAQREFFADLVSRRAVSRAVSWGLYVERYNTLTLAASSYLVLSYGLALFYGSAWQLRHRHAPWKPVLGLSILSTLFISLPFIMGYSGVGAFVANLVMAALLGITARECWLHRHETPTPLIVLTLLYSAVAVTFLLCAWFIVTTVPAQLEQAPQNWAEDLNALVSLLAITGIGATTLALNQSRLAMYHRTIALTDVLTGLGN